MKILKQALKTAALAAVVFSSQILAPVASLAGLTLLSSPAHAESISRICLSTNDRYIIETNLGAPCSKLFFNTVWATDVVRFRDKDYTCNKVGRWFKTDDFGQNDDNICNGMTKITEYIKQGYYHTSLGHADDFRNDCSSGGSICEAFADQFYLVTNYVYDRETGKKLYIRRDCPICDLWPSL